jgi:hypothetical protein
MAALPPSPLRLADFPSVRVVGSFEELVATRFAGSVNVRCWPRELDGDFAAIERQLPEVDDITSLDEDDLRGLNLRPAGAIARGPAHSRPTAVGGTRPTPIRGPRSPPAGRPATVADSNNPLP